MPIPTIRSLQRIRRRQDRRAAAKQKVIYAMRAGAALHRQHVHGHIQWTLSDGTAVSHQTAIDVRADLHVVGVGDALFDVELSQTFRYLE
jgi:hypothetical protein